MDRSITAGTASDREGSAARTRPAALADAPLVSHALFGIGDRVRHAVFEFSGIIFDIDPVFSNSEEWYDSNPLQPDRNQPFYHLIADNGEQSYIAYVSQQNLLIDDGKEPIDHPALKAMFKRLPDGGYALNNQLWQ